MNHIGYLAVFFGSLIEGETAIITGSFLSHWGYFELPKVMVIAMLAALFIDWVYFFISRKQGRKFFHRRPKLEIKLNRITERIETHPIFFMLFYRFMHGLRIPLAIAFGLSGFSVLQYGILSFIGTVLWVVSYSAIGYFFGAVIAANLTTIEHHEFLITAVILLLSLSVFYFIRKRNTGSLMKPTGTCQTLPKD